jgi:hypothetical protein
MADVIRGKVEKTYKYKHHSLKWYDFFSFNVSMK